MNLKFCQTKWKLFFCPLQQLTYVNQDSLSMSTKTKYRSRLNAEPDIRLKLSQIQPYSHIVQIKKVLSFSLEYKFPGKWHFWFRNYTNRFKTRYVYG
jgi:hypothetical protein